MRAGSSLNLPALPRANCTAARTSVTACGNIFWPFFARAEAAGERRGAGRGEIGPQVLESAAHPRLPSAAVRGNERGKGPRPDGQIKVAGERHAVMGGVGEAGVRFDGW